ncbi:phage tail assembly chaperone [Pseudomonas fluorescens]|uniref:phage tail assembly chaperone n=1 Tax=Pseudomonas fluorescens TaxID=294 RepID=UPI001240D7AE|nr:phage tail assembly chaperone [Pseudomonas fluorescens]
MYRRTDNPDVVQLLDGGFIPRGHPLWGEYEKWLSAGNVPAPMAGPSPLELAAVERVWRDSVLLVTDGLVARHRDEQEEGSETTLVLTQYPELQAYRRALRNWPESGEFPLAEHRPEAPTWLSQSLR